MLFPLRVNSGVLEIREEIHLRCGGLGKLDLDGVLRFRDLFLLLRFHGVEFEVGEDGLGLLDEIARSMSSKAGIPISASIAVG
jgi:hypothetical protein